VYVKGFTEFQFLPFKYFGRGIKWFGAGIRGAPPLHQDYYADDVGTRDGMGRDGFSPARYCGISTSFSYISLFCSKRQMMQASSQ
jgi:hypothetical protein